MVEFEAGEFQHAFGRASKIASRNSGGAGNAFGVHVAAVDDYALLTATDRTSIVDVSVPCKAYVPVEFTLPHHIIDKVVARAKGTLAFGLIDSKRGLAVDVTIDGREVGQVSVIDEPWNVEVPAADWSTACRLDELADGLSRCAWASQPNSTSPMLRSVHLTDGKLQATDTNRLAEIDIDYHGAPALLDVGALSGALAKAASVSLAFDGKLLHLQIDDATHFVTPTVVGVTYPKFENVFAATSGAKFTVSRSALTEAAEVVTAVFDRGGDPWVVLEASEGALLVSFSGEHGELAEELEIVDFDGEPFRVGLALSYLNAAFGATKEAEVAIDMAKTPKGFSMLRLDDGEGYRAAIATRRPE